MKPAKCLFVSIIQLLPFVIIGQNFIHFPDSGGIWKEFSHGFGGPAPPNHVVDNYFEGDTILYDTLYRRIMMQARDEFCSDSIVYGPTFYGWLREDTSNHKVYYRINSDFNEELLYDYTLEVGDTIPEGMGWMGNCDIYVSDLEAIVTHDGVSRRVWSYDCLADPFEQKPQVIEGIGSTWGLTGGIRQSMSWSDLLCLTEGNIVIWLGSQNSCNISTDTCATVGVEGIFSEPQILITYPNPTKTDVTFSFNFSNGKRQGSIEIRNLSGQLVGKLPINQVKNKVIYDASSLPPGIYICTLKTARIYAVRKLVVTK